MILNSSIVVASKDQVSCDLSGEAAILHLNKGIYYGLNPVGASIWDFIQTPKVVSEIREAIMQQYDVDANCCERDLFTLLSQLTDEGLIKVENAAVG